MAITSGELQQAQERFLAADLAREHQREERNRLIWQAIDEGWSYQQLADALGIEKSRVGQIAQARN